MEGIKKFMMAKRCENCPLCRYSRNNPNKLFSKMMALHGKFCPFWKAWEKEYGYRKDNL
jgi:hypothetical protein